VLAHLPAGRQGLTLPGKQSHNVTMATAGKMKPSVELGDLCWCGRQQPQTSFLEIQDVKHAGIGLRRNLPAPGRSSVVQGFELDALLNHLTRCCWVINAMLEDCTICP